MDLPSSPDNIIQNVSLDIDTRIMLRVKPGRLTNDPSYEHVREKLQNTHKRRTNL